VRHECDNAVETTTAFCHHHHLKGFGEGYDKLPSMDVMNCH